MTQGTFFPLISLRKNIPLKPVFLQYHQITSAIPSRLKQKSAEQPKFPLILRTYSFSLKINRLISKNFDVNIFINHLWKIPLAFQQR